MALDPVEIVGGLAIGEGLGGAIADTVGPRLQNFKNDQWSKHKDKPLDAATAAAVAAEEVDQYSTMETQASYSGYDVDRFADLYRVTLTAPGVGTLLELLRRDAEVGIDFTHGLRKSKLGNQWDAALKNLRDVRIPAPDLAYMVVRDLVPNPFTGSGPSGPNDTTIEDIPQLPIKTLEEASFSGWDATRFEALVGRSGLAPAPILAANAFFRGIITWEQYRTIIAKGDLRPAYTNVILNGARQINTAGEYAELELRGFYDRATRLKHTAKHGMSDADSDLLYNVLGRSIAVHQVTTGLARGGTYPAVYADVPQPYRAAIQRSNIREEWVGLDYANRYTYPSWFALRSLLTDGVFVEAEAAQLLLELGWRPDLAAKVAKHYAPTGAGNADPHLTKAHTTAWTKAQASYIAEEATAADVQPIFSLLAVDPTAQPEIIATWDAIRALVRKQLSPAQIKKALKSGVANPATGAPWTFQEGIDALLARGYDLADATVLLQE